MVSLGRPTDTNYNYHLDMNPPLAGQNWTLPVGQSYAGVTLTTVGANSNGMDIKVSFGDPNFES